MSKVLLVIDMSDEDYQLLEKYTKQKMIVDIGFNHDNMFGWTFMRRKVLCAKPMPQKNKYDVKKYAKVEYDEDDITLGHFLNFGWNDCIDEILKGEEE